MQTFTKTTNLHVHSLLISKKFEFLKKVVISSMLSTDKEKDCFLSSQFPSSRPYFKASSSNF